MERRFILQGLETQASIGIYDYERVAPQRIIIDAELCLYATTEPLDDQIGSVQSVRVRSSKPDAYNDCEMISYQLSNL